MGFTVVVHHGGAFVGDRMLGYEGGEVHAFHNLDVDSGSYFEALGLIKDLGYREAVKLWWIVGKGKKGKIFKSISWDNHALEMCQYAVDNNCEVDLYVEHTLVSQSVLLEESTLLTFNNEGEKEKEEVEQGVLGDQKLDDDNVEEGDGGNKSEDSFDGDEEYDGSDSADFSDDLHFSDSEEERNLGMDDGFEETIAEQDVVKEMVLKVKTTPLKNPILSPAKRAEKLTPKRGKRNIFEGQSSGVNLAQVDLEVFRAPDVEGKDTFDEDYVSDELYSDLDEGKCPLPPSEPDGDAQTTNVNSQTADKGKQTMESNSSVQQPSTKIQRTNKGKGKMVAEGRKSADNGNGNKGKAQVQGQNQKTAPKAQKGHVEQALKTASKAQKGKNQAPKTAPQAQKGKKEAPKIATKAPKTAPQGQHASSSQPKKPRLGSKGNKKQSANLEAEGVQVEVPPIPAYAKNLTVAQLLARMMTANNTWATTVRAHSEIHSTPSDVTMQEAEEVMPTHNSQVSGEKEDGSPNPN
ncbi:hypothetical protein SESBI_05080 [Sesbania bispinosa]|nr:hypothetical protein SESBI_05080 [Sesbania bispinosa]